MHIGDEMEIKEKDLYLAKLLEENVIKQDEFEDIKYKPEINAFCSKYLSAIFIDNINFGWSVWQAKAPPEGFVLVPKKSLKVALFWMDEDIDPWSMGGDSFADLFEHKPILEKALEAQEQSHDNSN